MQYSVRSTGKAEYLYFEEEAVKHIRPSGSGVELRLAYHANYIGNPAYKYDNLRNQFVLTLTKGQAIAVVEQDRKEAAFCTGCWDFGKTTEFPDGCVRCELIRALQRSGAGDHRQSRAEAVSVARTQSNGATCGMVLLILSLLGALNMWASASAKLEQVEKRAAQLERIVSLIKR